MPAGGGPTVEMVLHDARLRAEPGLRPQRATAGAAAYDLRACLAEPLTLRPQQMQVVSTGIAVHIGRPDIFALLAPRSGLGVTHGIVLANLVGVIDSDYTGEIKAGLWNRGAKDFVIEPYMRICQMILCPLLAAELHAVESFSAASARGARRFGSTGTG